MSSYENIYEVLNGSPSKAWIGHHIEELTVDQRIAAAQVIALAAIAEELSSISQHGIGQTERRDPEPTRTRPSRIR